MKSKEFQIVNVYTQADGLKVAISLLQTVKKSYYTTTEPTATVEQFGKIEGTINSWWGKLPVVLVAVEQFRTLSKNYEVVEFRGPVERVTVRESKPRPDAAALRLYKKLSELAAAPAPEADRYGYIEPVTFDGYTIRPTDAAALLKRLKSAFNFTKADTAAAYALTLDTPTEAPAHEPEPTAAPAADTTPVTVEAVTDAPAPAPAKKQLAAWRGAVVEVLDVRADDGAAVVKFKGGARSSVPAGDLEPTTAKKTAHPAWLVPGAVVELYSALRPDAAPTRHTVESVKTTTVYFTDGYSSMINYFMHYGEPVASDDATAADAADTTPAPVPEAVTADDAPAVTDADVLATAARIRARYEVLKAEADRQAAADAFAAAINHYCDYLTDPEPLPEPPAVVYLSGPVPPSPRRRSWLPRPSRWLARLGRVAALVLLPLLVLMLTATSSDNAATPAPDAEAVAWAIELAPVTVTAPAPADDTEAVALAIELPAVTVTADRPATPASQKSVCTPSSEKTALALAAAPSSQKTADNAADDAAPVPDTATDSPTATSTATSGPAPLVCCAGTPWAYTMMNWA